MDIRDTKMFFIGIKKSAISSNLRKICFCHYVLSLQLVKNRIKRIENQNEENL